MDPCPGSAQQTAATAPGSRNERPVLVAQPSSRLTVRGHVPGQQPGVGRASRSARRRRARRAARRRGPDRASRCRLRRHRVPATRRPGQRTVVAGHTSNDAGAQPCPRITSASERSTQDPEERPLEGERPTSAEGSPVSRVAGRPARGARVPAGLATVRAVPRASNGCSINAAPERAWARLGHILGTRGRKTSRKVDRCRQAQFEYHP